MCTVVDGWGGAFDARALEHDALYFVVRTIIRDRQRLSEPVSVADSNAR
jgi:hypothetical protein